MTVTANVATLPVQRAADADPRAPWQRLALLADRDPTLLAEAGGVTAAHVRIGGLAAVAFATDAREQGGALGAEGSAVICAAYAAAMQRSIPIVGLWQSGGARLREGVASLHGIGTVFAAMTAASGVIPQISLVLGPAAGGAAYGPALTDVVVMAPLARVFVTGPDVIRTVTGETITAGELGGPETHATSGVAHVVAASEDEGYARVREIVGLLTTRWRPARGAQRVDPATLLPASVRRAYDVRPVVAALLDQPPVELQAGWARNVLTALGRLEGRTVGVVATNPLRLGGCLTAASSDKAARFVRLCDTFGIPLLFLVDVPGYLPGSGQERDGVVRRGAKLLHAVAAARVPRVTVVTRKAYGGAFIAMNSRSLGATAVLAWPGAQVDVMSAEAAVRVLNRREIADAEGDPAVVAEFAARHAETTGGLDRALALGVVDAIVEPSRTRERVAELLFAEPARCARLGNIPL